jgi:DNA invertase Pin-like site-specific DNA recombinase
MIKNPHELAPRAYSYLRFSTPDQAKGDSLRRQTAMADEYAQRHGLTLDTELNLRDLGVSAFRGDNAAVGALGAFLQAIKDELVPAGSLLLVEALDRISRQTARKAVRILEDVVESGVTVVTLNDGKHYTAASLDGTDFLMAILLFMRGSDESATKARRLKASWEGKRLRAAKGEIQTGSVPAWIKVTGSAAKEHRNATLSLIPERADLVRRMFEMFLAGEGKHAIAEAFNAERIGTWGTSELWHSTYIFKILSSPTVTGRLVPHIESHVAGKRIRTPQETIEDYYPRVIDDETFQRAQTLAASRRGTVRSRSIASITAGIAKCPKCGSTMTRVMKGKRGGAPKLVCARAKAGAGCKYHLVKLLDIERAFTRNAAQLHRPPITENSLASDIDAADEELYQLGKQIEAIVDAIERKPSLALSQRLEERETQAVAVKTVLEQLRARAADSESRVVKHRAKRLADVLKAEPLAVSAANAAMRECIESVTVDYERGDLRLAWRHGPVTEINYDERFEDLDQHRTASAAR